MLKKRFLILSLVSLMLLALVACSNNTDSALEDQEEEIEQLEKEIDESNKMLVDAKALTNTATTDVGILMDENKELKIALEESKAMVMALEVEVDNDLLPAAISPYPGMTVLVAATHVLDAMRTDDYATLSTYVDPVNGVFVSPYQYIDFAYTMNLTDDNILSLATIPTIFPWGHEPGSGDLISLNMLDYFNEYIYDEDYYIAPIVGMNIVVSSGNMINNIATSFPTTDTVEFLFPQFDPSYGGLDWSSITLVFNTDSGMPMLIGIVHGQWTP